MFIWAIIILILIAIIWSTSLDIKLHNQANDLDIRENELNKRFEDMVDSFK